MPPSLANLLQAQVPRGRCWGAARDYCSIVETTQFFRNDDRRNSTIRAYTRRFRNENIGRATIIAASIEETVFYINPVTGQFDLKISSSALGIPGHIRSDSGPEFVAKAGQEWIAAVGTKAAYIERGSPWEKGYIESFNARLRDELLNGEIFYTLREARIVIESWRLHYNTSGPTPT